MSRSSPVCCVSIPYNSGRRATTRSVRLTVVRLVATSRSCLEKAVRISSVRQERRIGAGMALCAGLVRFGAWWGAAAEAGVPPCRAVVRCPSLQVADRLRRLARGFWWHAPNAHAFGYGWAIGAGSRSFLTFLARLAVYPSFVGDRGSSAAESPSRRWSPSTVRGVGDAGPTRRRRWARARCFSIRPDPSRD